MDDLVYRMPWEAAGASSLQSLLDREWLVTNSLGGYASGTISGASTRRYHGLLVAAHPAPLGRLMMFNHLSEYVRLPDWRTVQFGGEERAGGELQLHGAAYLTEFRLEAGLPVWRYVVEGLTIEKRVLLPHMQNTVHVTYELVSGAERVELARIDPRQRRQKRRRALVKLERVAAQQRQRVRDAVHLGTEALEIHPRAADAHDTAHLTRKVRQVLRALQAVLDAQQQFAKMKRLGQVVVGAELQAVNPLFRIAVGGEKNDRGLRHGGAQFARQVKSIAVRKPDVEQRELRGLGAPGLARTRGAGGQRHAVAGRLQPLGQRLPDVAFVFHHQQLGPAAHGAGSSALALKHSSARNPSPGAL